MASEANTSTEESIVKDTQEMTDSHGVGHYVAIAFRSGQKAFAAAVLGFVAIAVLLAYAVALTTDAGFLSMHDSIVGSAGMLFVMAAEAGLIIGIVSAATSMVSDYWQDGS